MYALAVGARATDLDLVFEERLRVLPGFALTLAQWAPDVLGSAGAFDVTTAVHGTQRLRVLKPLPRSGAVEMSARVGEVWDKGKAAVFDVVVESDYFEAAWSLFAPGRGGFGGERGPSARRRPEAAPDRTLAVRTAPDQAALYRLLGDRHHMHIDPEAAKAAGCRAPSCTGCAHWRRSPCRWPAPWGSTPPTWRSWRAASPRPSSRATNCGWTCGRTEGGVLFEAAVDDRAGHPSGLALVSPSLRPGGLIRLR